MDFRERRREELGWIEVAWRKLQWLVISMDDNRFSQWWIEIVLLSSQNRQTVDYGHE
jgi:hypothetical protein